MNLQVCPLKHVSIPLKRMLPDPHVSPHLLIQIKLRPSINLPKLKPSTAELQNQAWRSRELLLHTHKHNHQELYL